MLPYLTETFGNPSSAHVFGRAARSGLDDAHERLAARLHAEAREIVFTSGGTEANNLALKGAAWAGKAHGHRIVTTSVEHHAVGHTLRYLEKFGFEIVELPVDRYGRVDPDQLEAALTDRTILVSVMLANNEVGTLQPIAAVAERLRGRKGILFHVDAVQAAPYVDIDVEALGADLVAARCAQVRGPEGRGRAVRPPRDPHPGAAAGRYPGAPPARRDRERGRGRRDGGRIRPVVRGAARDRRAPGPPARPPREGRPGRRGHGDDRSSQGPAAGSPLDHRAATPTGARSRSRSTSRASPPPSGAPVPPGPPRSATC